MTGDDEKRRILERVADGSLSPTEGAERLAALEAGDEPAADDPIRTDAPEPARPLDAGTIHTIKVRGTFRAVEVIGDPSVREAVGTGRHEARYEGDVLVIDGGLDIDGEDDDDDDDWFRFGRRGGLGYRRMGVRLRSETALQVRMNPDLELDAKIEAGPLTVRGITGPIKARVAAGPLKIDDFEGPLDLHVAAGPIKARGRLTSGDSRVQCEAGSVNINLDESSSVRVKASATLGKVHLLGRRDRSHDRDRDWHWEDVAGPGVTRIVTDVLGKLGDTHEATFGAGEGTLEVEVSMGAVHIDAD
jgi:hypothetical protein